MAQKNKEEAYKALIVELYDYIVDQNCIIEKMLAYMDEIKVDCMPIKRKSPLRIDNNALLRMENLSKTEGPD